MVERRVCSISSAIIGIVRCGGQEEESILWTSGCAGDAIARIARWMRTQKLQDVGWKWWVIGDDRENE